MSTSANELFISKAKLKHGDTYDYSSTSYTGYYNKVNVLCRKHGEFMIWPGDHLKGSGCRICGIDKIRSSTSNFITKAITKHGDRYDYSKVDYKHSEQPVTIICNEHGEFEQTPHGHLTGNGCNKCFVSRVTTTQDAFIAKAKEIHGDKYDYSKVNYKQSFIKVTIVCKTHGDFEQRAVDHISGRGCPICANKYIASVNGLTQEQFITKAKEIHGDTYTYDNAVYNGHGSPITITCKIHGDFKSVPGTILRGNGCAKCAGENRRLEVTEFITRAKKTHGDTYDYSKVEYVSLNSKVVIVCKKHGEFLQRPGDHIRGDGCPGCSESKGERKVTLFLDKLDIKYTRQYKLPNSKYRYDCYIPSLNILIEYDGQLHFMAVKHFGGMKYLINVRESDANKTALAALHHIPLIRIPYTEYDNLENYLLKALANHYRYRVKDKFYKNFIELCKGESLSPETTIQDVKKHLFVNSYV